MIDFAPWMNLFSVFDFKECHPLTTALEETLPRALMIDVHAEEVDVKLLRPGEILNMQHYVVDAGNLERGFHNSPPV
jgi:hypothetical protein